MFSGIVRTRGEIVLAEPRSGGMRLGVRTSLPEAGPGSSVAVNGVCLTVVESRDGVVFFDAVGATLRRTLLGEIRPGARVNLEPSLRVGDTVDGHWVTGHVDGVGTVRSRRPGEGAVWFTIDIPPELSAQIALRGSVAVDGVSLTVAGVDGNAFEVSIVPYTLEVTIFEDYEPGRRVHLETDVLAKYVDHALAALDTRKSS